MGVQDALCSLLSVQLELNVVRNAALSVGAEDRQRVGDGKVVQNFNARLAKVWGCK